MKIMIKKEDMIRLLIVSRKLGKKSFIDPNLEDLQIVYNCYLYILFHSEKEYLNSATALLAILDIMIKDPLPSILNPLPHTLNPPPQFEPTVPLHNLDQVFCLVLFYAMQSPTSKERSTLLKNLHTDNKYSRFLSNSPQLQSLLDNYRNSNLISTNIAEFGVDTCMIYQPAAEKCAEENREILRKVLIKHNVGVTSVFYKRAKLVRLAQLFGAQQSEVENVICEMVSDEQLVAKIDRLDGVVVFGRNKLQVDGELAALEANKATINRGDEEILDEWVDDVNQLMELVD
jgi:26S proteasome regulatory subunit N5